MPTVVARAAAKLLASSVMPTVVARDAAKLLASSVMPIGCKEAANASAAELVTMPVASAVTSDFAPSPNSSGVFSSRVNASNWVCASADSVNPPKMSSVVVASTVPSSLLTVSSIGFIAPVNVANTSSIVSTASPDFPLLTTPSNPLNVSVSTPRAVASVPKAVFKPAAVSAAISADSVKPVDSRAAMATSS